MVTARSSDRRSTQEIDVGDKGAKRPLYPSRGHGAPRRQEASLRRVSRPFLFPAAGCGHLRRRGLFRQGNAAARGTQLRGKKVLAACRALLPSPRIVRRLAAGAADRVAPSIRDRLRPHGTLRGAGSEGNDEEEERRRWIAPLVPRLRPRRVVVGQQASARGLSAGSTPRCHQSRRPAGRLRPSEAKMSQADPTTEDGRLHRSRKVAGLPCSLAPGARRRRARLHQRSPTPGRGPFGATRRTCGRPSLTAVRSAAPQPRATAPSRGATSTRAASAPLPPAAISKPRRRQLRGAGGCRGRGRGRPRRAKGKGGLDGRPAGTNRDSCYPGECPSTRGRAP